MPDASLTCAHDPVVTAAVDPDPVDRPDPTGAPVVVVRDLQKHYGTTPVLHGV
jgi:hypothetical protein